MSCKILQRDSNSKDSFGNYSYTLSDERSCLFLNEEGTRVTVAGAKDIIISGMFYLSANINEYDRILFDDYIYDVVKGGVLRKKSYLTGRTEYYKVYVERRRLFNENEITINPRVV
jgi:hypothetical protein